MTAAELNERIGAVAETRRDARFSYLRLANMEIPHGISAKALADGVIWLESLAALEAELRAEVERVEGEES